MFKKKIFKLRGSFSAQNSNYASFRMPREKEAHSYYLNGNINISILEQWSLPFSFAYSNSNQDIGHGIDYNQFLTTPSYKWIKLYAGNSSMSFSPYSLSGHSFTGIGIELTPSGKLSGSLMYGLLQKANKPKESDTDQFSYKRLGGGFKLNYKNGNKEYQLISFIAKDDRHSIDIVPINTKIYPMENFVIGFKTTQNILDKIVFEIDYSNSLITTNTNNNSKYKSKIFFDLRPNLINTNSSSIIYKAFNSKLNFVNKDISLGLEYTRVDPDYKSLGGYFFTNDTENIAINFSKQLLKSKLSLSSSLGLQRNDLKDEKDSKMKNISTTINLSWNINDKTSSNFTYSNQTNHTNIRSDFEDINSVENNQLYDSLDFTQINQSLNFSLNKRLGKSKTENIQNLNINSSLQFSADKKGKSDAKYGDKFYANNISYSISLKKQKININSSLNSNYNDTKDQNSLTIGPSVNLSKAFKSKIAASSGISWNKSFINGKSQNRVFVLRTNLAYKINKHNFSVRANYMNKDNNLKTTASFNLNFMYSISF
ncbi:MAG: hypothetical protein N4A49_08555 [Marinifilaceae bacterium]|nr:hypothetical protein [Marinifilaceae bacterium]